MYALSIYVCVYGKCCIHNSFIANSNGNVFHQTAVKVLSECLLDYSSFKNIICLFLHFPYIRIQKHNIKLSVSDRIHHCYMTIFIFKEKKICIEDSRNRFRLFCIALDCDRDYERLIFMPRI